METQTQTQLNIDDFKGVIGSLVIEAIVKDKRIKELEAEIERLQSGNGQKLEAVK